VKKRQWSGVVAAKQEAQWAFGVEERSGVILGLSSASSSRSSRWRCSQGGTPLVVAAATQLGDEGHLGGADTLGVEVQLHGEAIPWNGLHPLLPASFSSLLPTPPCSYSTTRSRPRIWGKFSPRVAAQGEEEGGSIYMAALGFWAWEQAAEIPRRPRLRRPHGAHPGGRSGAVPHDASRYRAGALVMGRKKTEEGTRTDARGPPVSGSGGW
jgi:hypothetical protein